MNYVLTTLLCIGLAFCNVLFIVLTFAQIGDSAPLLYIEFILYYSILLILLGRTLRSFYKRLVAKRSTKIVEKPSQKDPVIGSAEAGKRMISLEILRMSTESKSLK